MTTRDASALSDELLARIADRLKAMADPTRLKLLHLLEGGEHCVGDLVEVVGGTQANVSKHLKVLRNAGLVRSRRSGMNVCYSLEEPAVFEICRLTCGCLERQATGIVADLGGATEDPGLPA
jgi:DNA-binding transcriptional ArsR family regulator